MKEEKAVKQLLQQASLVNFWIFLKHITVKHPWAISNKTLLKHTSVHYQLPLIGIMANTNKWGNPRSFSPKNRFRKHTALLYLWQQLVLNCIFR